MPEPTPRPNPLLLAAAIIYGAAALALLFAPEELSQAATGSAPSTLDAALLQLLAAGLFGFALLAWMQRFTVTAGVYGRPIVVANFAHTATAALSLLHVVRRGPAGAPLLGALALYAALALAFGWTLLRPLPKI